MMEATKRSDPPFSGLSVWLAAAQSSVTLQYTWISLACCNVPLQIRLWMTCQGDRFEHIDSYATATCEEDRESRGRVGLRDVAARAIDVLLFATLESNSLSSLPFRDNARGDAVVFPILPKQYSVWHTPIRRVMLQATRIRSLTGR